MAASPHHIGPTGWPHRKTLSAGSSAPLLGGRDVELGGELADIGRAKEAVRHSP